MSEKLSQIKYTKRSRYVKTHKDTRWDRIRKRYAIGPSFVTSLKTDVIRHFIEKDYIGKNYERVLNGGENAQALSNPTLVMDLRHEMFKRTAQKLPLATLAHRRNNESCILHNMALEEHYLGDQLHKFRQQLQNNHRRNKVYLKTVQNSLQLDNKVIKQSLDSSSKHIGDFYAAPMEAMEKLNKLCEAQRLVNLEATDQRDVEEMGSDSTQNTNEKEISVEKSIIEGKSEKLDEDLKIERHTPSPPTSSEEILKRIRKSTDERQPMNLQLRCVRFGNQVEVRKYNRENSSCSNTSDGFESVISDLAEEALIELQMEEATITDVACKINDTNTNRIEIPTNEHLGEKLMSESVSNCEKNVLEMEGGQTILPVENNEVLIIKHLKTPNDYQRSKKTKDIANLKDDEEGTHSDREKNHIIEQLFQSRAVTNITILRKYFLKWIHYTTIEKIERENLGSKHDRIHMINIFLDKIRKDKVRHFKKLPLNSDRADKIEVVVNNSKQQMSTNNLLKTKKFQNKIKIQQDVIDLQRLKLERQERLIMELKLNKLSEEAKEARRDIKDELKSVIHYGDPKAKAKAKCLQIIGDLRDADKDNMASLQGRALLVPKFLQHMQERALERGIRHEQARQRRLKQEAEREAKKIEAEETKRQEDEEAKRERILALKEKRRQEKMFKILKERERQHAIENHRKSQEFCRRLLLRRIGMEGFKRLLQMKRDNQRKCEILLRERYRRNYLLGWHSYCVLQFNQKLLSAINLYNKMLKRQTLAAWQWHMQQGRSKYLLAIDWHELKLSECLFMCWWNFSKREKLIEHTKMRQAISHHEWHLKWKVLDCWQRLSQILALERETEERRQRWRMKIWELLPDYTPNRDNFFIN